MSWVVLSSALWLGILTSISPCPMATNIAAISFIGRKAGQKDHVLGSGLLYSCGRTLAYVVLGFILTGGLLATADLSLFLQQYMNEVLGPIMIILGLVLLGWLGGTASVSFGTDSLQEKAAKGSIGWAFPIGAVFALSFCPVSAGLFFGGLIPLAVKQESILLIPVLYGVGTSLPVVVFAFIMAFFSSIVGNAFDVLGHIELWIRRITGSAFILAGIYYSLVYIYEI